MSEDTDSTKRAKNIATGIRSLTVQNLLTSTLALVFLAVAIRELSPEDYGIYTAAVLCATIVSTVASFGLQSAAARFVAMLQEKDHAKAWAAGRAIIVFSLLFGSIAGLALAGFSPLLSLFFTRSTDSSFAFVVAASYAFAGTLAPGFQGLVQGLRKYSLLATIILVSRVAMTVFMIITILFTHNLLVPVLAWTLYSVIVILWSLRLTLHGLMTPAPHREYSSVIGYIAPLELAGAVNIASTYSDRVVVGGYQGATSLGIYNVAVMISNVLSVVLLLPLNTAFLPEVSSSTKSSEEVASGVKLAIRYAGLAIVPSSFAVAAMATQLLKLFSGQSLFLAGTVPLEILAMLFIFTALQGLLSSLLQALGKTTQVLIMGGAMVATDIGLALVLVPILGISGAAVSDALVGVVGFGVGLWFARPYISNLKIDYAYFVKVFMGSFVVFLILSSLSVFVSSRPLSLIPYTVLGLAVYLGILKATRALGKEDKQYLMHFVPSGLRKLVDFL